MVCIPEKRRHKQKLLVASVLFNYFECFVLVFILAVLFDIIQLFIWTNINKDKVVCAYRRWLSCERNLISFGDTPDGDSGPGRK